MRSIKTRSIKRRACRVDVLDNAQRSIECMATGSLSLVVNDS